MATIEREIQQSGNTFGRLVTRHLHRNSHDIINLEENRGRVNEIII
jgi:Trk K+ transport system NAD-binding subunit